MHRGDANQIGVSDSPVTVGIIAIEIRIIIGIAAIIGVDTAHVLPAVGHVVVVSIGVEWTGEVLRPPCIGDLVLLDIIQAVLVCIAIGISGVGWIKEAATIGIQRIAVLEAIWHAVTIGIPVARPIEASVVVHVLLKPGPVAVAAHVLGVR